MYSRPPSFSEPSSPTRKIFPWSLPGPYPRSSTPPKSQAITYQDVASLAHHFGVSYEAAAWRLKNLGWLNAPETDALIEQKSVGKRYGHLLGFMDNLFDETPSKERYEDQELRSQLAHLAIEAYRREEISRGRLLELGRKLDLPGDELLDLAEAARGD